MGPERSEKLFDEFATNAVKEATGEFERNQRAEEVLGALSEEFEEMPIVSPMAEPTLAAKMHALSKLGVDKMGIAGFNPMAMIYLDGNGMSMKAVAAPAHDRFEQTVHGQKVAVQTRAIMIKPPEEVANHRSTSSTQESDLEFFGLNMYVVSSEDVGKESLSQEENITDLGDSSGTIPLTPAARRIIEAQQELIIAKGQPLLGVTNIFAVRHKEYGIVKIYGVTVAFNPLGDSMISGRDSDQKLTVPLPNSMTATVAVLEGELFDEALNEFTLATEAVHLGKTAQTTFDIIERYALRETMSGRNDPGALQED